MKARYLLKKRSKTKGATHPIYIALYEGEQTEIIYTGQRCTRNEWSEADRKPRDEKGVIYKEISKVMEAVNKAKIRLEAAEQAITPFTIKQAYEALIKEKGDAQLSKDKLAKAGLKSVASLGKQWLEDNLFGYQKSTQKAVTESINQFFDFLKKAGLQTLERKDLNQEVIDSYAKYLLEKKKLADSTHGKRMKHLRWFLKWLKYDYRDIKIRSGRKTKIHLELDELNKLEALDVSANPMLQRAKDMYLLGCWTGQRISDLKRFNRINTSGGVIKLRQVKSGNEIEIPIGKVVASILTRHGDRSPKISEGDLNTNIKAICKLAKIDRMVEIETTKGGQTIRKAVPIYEEITSHTSGKTFASVVAPYVYKLSPAETAAIMGKDLKTVLSYYGKPSAEAARLKILEFERESIEKK
jgi:site-specific recombinase XerD